MLKNNYIREKREIASLEHTLKTMEENQDLLNEMLEDEISNEEKESFKSDMDVLKKELSEIQDYSNNIEINNRENYIKVLKEELEKIDDKTPLIKERIEKQIKLLEEIFELHKLNKYKSRVPRKVSSSDINTLRIRVRKKLAVNKKLIFTEPSLIEKAIKEVLDSSIANRVIYLVYTFILETKMNINGNYIYFLLLTLQSVNKEEMKDREVVIENLKNIF